MLFKTYLLVRYFMYDILILLHPKNPAKEISYSTKIHTQPRGCVCIFVLYEISLAGFLGCNSISISYIK